MDRSQLVLGVATNLPASEFEPFFRSLRKTGYRGQTGIILSNYTSEEARVVGGLADIVWNLDEEESVRVSGPSHRTVAGLKFLKRQRGLRRLYGPAFQAVSRLPRERNSQSYWAALERETQGLQSLRYGLYYEFLHRFAPEAQTVFLSDLRDVAFQSPPLSAQAAPLEFFLEDQDAPLGDDVFNARWVKDLYGAAALDRVKHHPISCCGTVAGQREPILRYLHEMDRSLICRRRALGPHDQGVHNYLLRTGVFPEAKIFANGEGRVLTMGTMKKFIMTGGLVTVGGVAPAVLHQYDRHPELIPQLACLRVSGE